jgi:hypothetical protein
VSFTEKAICVDRHAFCLSMCWEYKCEDHMYEESEDCMQQICLVQMIAGHIASSRRMYGERWIL